MNIEQVKTHAQYHLHPVESKSDLTMTHNANRAIIEYLTDHTARVEFLWLDSQGHMKRNPRFLTFTRKQFEEVVLPRLKARTFQ